jgi:ribonuclease P protein component
MTRFGLPRSARLGRASEITALLREGRRQRMPHLDVYAAPSPAGRPRLGVIVGRHRQTAVARNRLKRRLREIGRLEVLPRLREAGCAADVLLRARPEAYAAGFRTLRGEVLAALERLWSRVC